MAVSARTMQVPLSDEGEGGGEYVDGQLVFVEGQVFHQPKRPAGSATRATSCMR
jgi:hypothetical protein